MKAKIIIAAIVFVAGIIAILALNKQKLEAKSRNDKITSYAVSTAEAKMGKVDNTLELVGTITGNNDVAVVSEAQGKILNVYAKVGDYKSAGSVLFQLDDELKQSAYKTAEVNYEKAKKDFERFESLYKEKSVTDNQYEQAKMAYQSAESQYITARRQYNDTKIKAPISGVVTARNVDLGNYVKTNDIVANIVDISKLKVKLSVSEKDAFQLKTGDNVKVKTDVYPGVEFTGKIEYISSKGDEAHTYPVEISLPNNSKNPLKAGMFATVSFNSTRKGETLLIPREALVGSVKNARVFVVENNNVRLRSVTLGNTYNEALEVLQGLKAGDKVVVNGQNNLKDMDNVTVKN